jgi:hypothetical protein
MAAGSVPITPGSGKFIAVYEFTEGGEARELQRMVLSNSAGAELPLPTSLGAGNGLKVEFAVGGQPFSITGPVTIADISAGEYEPVAALQTNQPLGPTGALNDWLDHILVVPATTSPGAIAIKDGSNTAITVFTGGASSVSNLVPFAIPIMAKSVSGAWQITTGANVSAVGFGNFT